VKMRTKQGDTSAVTLRIQVGVRCEKSSPRAAQLRDAGTFAMFELRSTRDVPSAHSAANGLGSLPRLAPYRTLPTEELTSPLSPRVA
jgi:hypothetical protein